MGQQPAGAATATPSPARESYPGRDIRAAMDEVNRERQGPGFARRSDPHA
jgi:hypothetical protein